MGNIAYGYDANNNLTTMVEAGKTNVWTYDAYDRVATYRDADGSLIQYAYDQNGNLTTLVYPGNKTVSYAYDSLNRLTNVTDWASRVTSIEYDLASRVTKITRPNGTKREMSYDVAGQMTNIFERKADNAALSWVKLNWNSAARVESEFIAPPPQPSPLPARGMTYDDDNRIATFRGQSVTYDGDGNLTYGPLTESSFSSYTYDARNRLLSAGGFSYGYDASGNRIAITNGANVTRFVVNPNVALSQVLMRVKNGITNYYVYGLGLLYEADDAGNTRTYHYDSRGSTIAITDGSAAVTDRIEYSAYGSISYRTGNTDTAFLYNGRYGVQTDSNGLLHMRARYYNPYLCRFLNPDPIGFSGGLNFFAYADGNPITIIDPSGTVAWALPPQLHQDPEFTRGFYMGAGGAVPAAVGMAGAVALGPVAGGATLSAGINTTDQLLRQFTQPGAEFSVPELATHTVIGAALPYALGEAVPYAASLLPNSVKGAIGEALSYINGIFQGRGFTPALQQTLYVAGREPIPDLTYAGLGSRGGDLYVEAKFGTSQLSDAQRVGARAMGENWITERWTYPWIRRTSARIGSWLSGANAAGSSPSATENSPGGK